MSFFDRNPTKVIRVGLIFGVILTSLDVAVDLRQGVTFDHVIHECLLIVFFLLMILIQSRFLKHQTSKVHQKNHEIQCLLWNQELRTNFHDAIQNQFQVWRFSDSESAIAILLIKGFSMKEIAGFRQSKESTVRQQAASLYRKANIEGRQQLSAYFLEDLL